MSISSEIERIKSAKSTLKTYLTDNNVAVPDGAKIDAMAEALAAISGSPIVDDSLENTVQYRQMNLSAAGFLADVDYTENANDYSVTKVIPYYSATTTYSKEEPDGLKI